MKKKTISFIGIITAAISLASCNYIDIFSKRVTSVSLSDSTSAYLVGQIFYERCQLSMTATYNDGSTLPLNKDNVSYTLTYNKNTYDVKTAFTIADTYKLTVQYEGVTSSSIDVKVFSNEQYVSSINVTTNEHNVEETKHLTIELSISPSAYTVPIEYEIGDQENRISIERNSDTSYRVKGLAIGETSIIFKAKNSATTYVTKTFSISVIPSTKVDIAQTYNHYVKKNFRAVSACPTVGNVNLLIIPVWFTDSETFINVDKKEDVREDIRKTYFGSTDETGWHSVSSYYQQESVNALNLSGTVSEWYDCNLASSTVAAYDVEKDSTAQDNLVKNAVNWYFGTNDSLRKEYDSDSDGYLDAVMLIYGAADDQCYSYSGSNMWAYCFWIGETSQKNVNKPGANVFFWASYDFMYSGGKNSKAQERTGKTYGNGDTRYCNLDAHTFIHEMGHVFGLEDYYDYNQSVTNPAAGFSMQDHNVGGHDPFSVMAMGWADPYIPESSGTININDFQSSHDIILLSPGWNVYNSPFDEYVLLELYSNTGLNKYDCDHYYRNSYAQGPQSVGIRVWHVDARLITVSYQSYSASFCSPNVNNGRVTHAFNNTSSIDVRACDAYSYHCPGGEENQTFNILQLIRNSKTKTYSDTANLSSSDLFDVGSSFSIADYYRQFPKGTKLDGNNKELGWTFTVKSITNNGDNTHSAEIVVTRV